MTSIPDLLAQVPPPDEPPGGWNAEEAAELQRVRLAVVPAREAEEEQGQESSLNLPEAFWDARPVLGRIRDAARSRFVSPDAVLGIVLARQSAYLHPGDNVDLYGNGFGAPLTVFTIPLGHPGTGKGQALRCAADLLPVPDHLTPDGFRERSLGSGEGLIEAYYGYVTESEPDGTPSKTKGHQQVRQNVLFQLDEGEALLKMLTRSGTTIAPTIRSAWSGENIGQANASADRDRQLLTGGYSIGLVVAFQPDTIGPLFDPKQIGGGTPHRFLFCSTLDPAAPEELPTWPGPLLDGNPRDSNPSDPWPHARPTRYVLTDPAIRREIIAARRAVLLGETTLSEQDTHVNQFRGRVAAHLARWEGRRGVNAEDWHLAGLVMDTSGTVRDSAIQHGRSMIARQTEERTRHTIKVGVRTQEALAEAAERRERDKVARGAAVLTRRVGRDSPTEGVEHRALKDSAGRYKTQFADCLSYATEAGWIVPEKAGRGTRYLPGPKAHEVAEQ